MELVSLNNVNVLIQKNNINVKEKKIILVSQKKAIWTI